MQIQVHRVRQRHMFDLYGRLESTVESYTQDIKSILGEAASRIDPFPEMTYCKISTVGLIKFSQPGVYVGKGFNSVCFILLPDGLYQFSTKDKVPVWASKEEAKTQDYFSKARVALEEIEKLLEQ